MAIAIAIHIGCIIPVAMTMTVCRNVGIALPVSGHAPDPGKTIRTGQRTFSLNFRFAERYFQNLLNTGKRNMPVRGTERALASIAIAVRLSVRAMTRTATDGEFATELLLQHQQYTCHAFSVCCSAEDNCCNATCDYC